MIEVKENEDLINSCLSCMRASYSNVNGDLMPSGVVLHNIRVTPNSGISTYITTLCTACVDQLRSVLYDAVKLL